MLSKINENPGIDLSLIAKIFLECETHSEKKMWLVMIECE